jgi:hypothetical protein
MAEVTSEIADPYGNPVKFSVAEVDGGAGIGVDSYDITITQRATPLALNLSLDELVELHRIIGEFLAEQPVVREVE